VVTKVVGVKKNEKRLHWNLKMGGKWVGSSADVLLGVGIRRNQKNVLVCLTLPPVLKTRFPLSMN
jgi:hypothetical protein